MFSYYGAKTNLVQHYPRPHHNLIIEPFAGSARYSLKYFEKDVLLVDKYEVIIKIWKWLQVCSPGDILKLPMEVRIGSKVNDFTFDCEEAKMLFSFAANRGDERVHNRISKRTAEARPGTLKHRLKRIANSLYKIKHWKIIHGSFENIENEKATWFIDPPYEFGGHAYPCSNKKIDFAFLAEWCKSRTGQVIVCENTKATWLDFKPMIEQRGSVRRTTEAIWTNEPTHFDNVQQKLF